MAPPAEAKYRLAILKAHKKEQNAELGRLGAEYAFRRQQICDRFSEQRREEVEKINQAILKVDQTEATEIEKVARSHGAEVEAAKARHSTTLAAVRVRYQIPENSEHDHSATLVASGSDEDHSSLNSSPNLQESRRKRRRVTAGDGAGDEGKKRPFVGERPSEVYQYAFGFVTDTQEADSSSDASIPHSVQKGGEVEDTNDEALEKGDDQDRRKGTRSSYQGYHAGTSY